MTLKKFYQEVESGSYKGDPGKAAELFLASKELQKDLVDRFKSYQEPFLVASMIDAYLRDNGFNELERIKVALYATDIWRQSELLPELKDYTMEIHICLN